MSTVPATIEQQLPPALAFPVRPAPTQAGALTFGDVWRIIKQHLWLIIGVFILVFGATCVGTYFWLKYYPTYTAYALVLVESVKPETILGPQLPEREPPQDAVSRLLQNQAALVKTEAVLNDALRNVQVRDTEWYRNIEEDRRIVELQEQLVVSPLEGTSLLRIAMSCRRREDPARIVNAVVDAYINAIDQEARRKYRSMVDDFQKELDDIGRNVEQKLKEIESFRESISVPGAVSGAMVTVAGLEASAQLIQQLAATVDQLKALYDTYSSVAPEAIAVSPQMQALVESDPMVAGMTYRMNALQEELAVQLQRLGPNHPTVKQLTERLAVVQEELARRKEIRLDEIKRYQIDQTRVAYLNARDQLFSMRERHEKLLAQQRDLDRQMAHYQLLQDQLESEKEKYELLYTKVTDMKLVLKRQRTVDVTSYARAVDPLEPSSPKLILNIPVGAFLGLFLAVGLALLLDLADTSIRTPRDIMRFLNLPVLGTVADLDDEEVVIERIETVMTEHPDSMTAESFRTIRTNLSFSAPAEQQRTVLVTSPQPEDGKTAIAVNLATATAQTGKRVLLIDANFRRPALHAIYDGDRGRGLSHVLIGQAGLDDVVRKTALPNLDVVFTGPIPPNPAEQVGSPQMRSFLQEALQRYDQVFIDAPPVLLVSDALVLATIVDGVVLVCRAQSGSRGVAIRARDLLERIQARIFGVVLNGAVVRRGGYYREQLRNYYDYLAEGREAAGVPQLAADKGEGGDGEGDGSPEPGKDA